MHEVHSLEVFIAHRRLAAAQGEVMVEGSLRLVGDHRVVAVQTGGEVCAGGERERVNVQFMHSLRSILRLPSLMSLPPSPVSLFLRARILGLGSAGAGVGDGGGALICTVEITADEDDTDDVTTASSPSTTSPFSSTSSSRSELKREQEGNLSIAAAPFVPKSL